MSSPGSPPILSSVAISIDSGSIAILTYNRPQKGNALNVPFLKDLLAALQWAESSSQIRIIITTGAGRFYTNGLDFLDPTNSTPTATISPTFIQTIGAIHTLLITTDKVLIAAVNGPAPGWGTTSIALHDIVYAVADDPASKGKNSLFFTPFVQWGICAEGCSSLLMPAILGRAKASALLLAGDRFSAEDLERAGLITQLFSREKFWEEGVLKKARAMAKLPAEALKVNKKVLMEAGDFRNSLLRTNETEMACLAEQAQKPESLEAVAKFRAQTEERARRKKEEAKTKSSAAKL